MPDLIAPEGRTDIPVVTPLPSSIVMTLGRLIDLAWPGAELAAGNQGEITFRVNTAVTAEASPDEVATAKLDPAEGDVLIQELGPHGLSLATPAEFAAALLPVLKASFQENPDAAKFLETAVPDPEDYNRHVMIFARSAQQTPHEQMMRAEQKLAIALQDAHRANATAVNWLPDSGPGDRPDTYQAGVKAAWDAMRELNQPNKAEPRNWSSHPSSLRGCCAWWNRPCVGWPACPKWPHARVGEAKDPQTRGNGVDDQPEALGTCYGNGNSHGEDKSNGQVRENLQPWITGGVPDPLI
jgi:hypothetical protein